MSARAACIASIAGSRAVSASLRPASKPASLSAIPGGLGERLQRGRSTAGAPGEGGEVAELEQLSR